MTRINIPLDADIVPPDLPPGSDTKLASYRFFLEQLGQALESERGIKLTFGSNEEAKGSRLKFYRARRYVAGQGVTSFDRLTLIVEGNSLLIKKDMPPEIEEL